MVVVEADDPDASGLRLDSISPDNGPGGTQVTFTGVGFGDVLGCGEEVAFNGQFVDHDDVLSWSDTQVVALAPSDVSNGYAGIVTNGITSNGIFYTAGVQPVLDSISPDNGAVGSQVTFTGSGFGDGTGPDDRVVFRAADGNPITATTSSWSDTTIVATVPAGAVDGYIGVVRDGNTSNGKYFFVTPS